MRAKALVLYKVFSIPIKKLGRRQRLWGFSDLNRVILVGGSCCLKISAKLYPFHHTFKSNLSG